ncbi:MULTISPECIES: NTF2 fold immunity protein [Snodgrassella]|uniref:NTF2 fold immunity protein n=1 Tax=Snodgrassella TaxID=1193515 RepID=UPI00226AD403|nr:NTF2 fold immunity protein [Snodgrassella sp. B3800]MCX8747724.1 hypothetical protein [Snodgrassella sp. B3800]
MKNNIEEAVSILKNFILAMNKWEGYCEPLTELIENGEDEEPLQNKMRSELNDIFNQYCTDKKRKYGRQVSLDCGYPPEYSPDEEILKIEELSKNKLLILTKQHTEFKNQFRYTLVYKNKEWRIDKKEVFDKFDNKWEKYAL